MNILEKEILGCFLKDNTLLGETSIKTNYFSSESSRLLFQSMLMLAHEHKKIDKVTLLASNYDYISSLGGPSFITELESIGNVDNFETYEAQFIDQYKSRQSKRIAKKWLSDENRENEDLITNLQKLEELTLSDEISKND